MHEPLDHLSPNHHIPQFFDSITRKKSTVYEISIRSRGPLEHLLHRGSSEHQDINNLLLINNITTFTQPLFTQRRRIPPADVIADCSPCFSQPQSSLCLDLSESPHCFLVIICEICNLLNTIYQNTFGNVIRNLIAICSLVKKSLLFYWKEQQVLSFLHKNNNISPFKRGGYVASASALYHARKVALSLLSWKIVSLVIGILAVLALIAFIVGAIFTFHSQSVFSDAFFMSPAACALGCGGIIFLLLGLISSSYEHHSKKQRQAAVDSIHRSLLSLYISDKIRVSTEESDDFTSLIARSCLSHYGTLLDHQTFPPCPELEYDSSSDISDSNESESLSFEDPREFMTSPVPPPYIELPPTYEEVMEEDRRNRENNNPHI
ncbi:inner membrane protein [Chlamydia abortus]|uniref:Inner membrane protein n=1 Tax=Chlamydia abortus (strain DSM 27085 / S26/3) TaxID=218497 RepID=Q5L5V9_CHLAB|nr:membrane protein [Chlamydia abortus]AUS59990.1 uncharacterized protein CHAB577_0569 [Chlamydia abortus]CAH63973.1 putative inner membrane protein [Chlamydia abortus S26/3]SFV97550.1 inner membrane protein [Chlamydia abortus]SFV97553.1 inner membrane protein [Chlamydia abortus]SFV99305.1 inner membrane protein [Chlamydia abortus]